MDDNARALLLTAYLEQGGPLPRDIALLQSRYLGFLLHAYNEDKGRFRNFMSYARGWLEDVGSEDSQGRSLWALGAMVGRCKDENRRDLARTLFDQSSVALFETTSPRTWAYGVLGAHEYLRGFPHERNVQFLRKEMAAQLWSQYHFCRTDKWPWFEETLSYGNARLPQALIIAGATLGNDGMLESGIESLTWLMALQSDPEGVFAPMGTQGYFAAPEERSYFDQQPIEASSSVSACLSAARITGLPVWASEADRSFDWFLGKNMLGKPLYDKTSGGCHDGLHPDRVNRNQGAESTLSFLFALIELQNAAGPRKAAGLHKKIHELK